jgi:hypothetical protein
VLIDDDDAGIGADEIIGDCRDALHDRHRHREITAVGGKPCGRFRKMRQHQIAASEMIGSDEPVGGELVNFGVNRRYVQSCADWPA